MFLVYINQDDDWSDSSSEGNVNEDDMYYDRHVDHNNCGLAISKFVSHRRSLTLNCRKR